MYIVTKLTQHTGFPFLFHKGLDTFYDCLKIVCSHLNRGMYRSIYGLL